MTETFTRHAISNYEAAKVMAEACLVQANTRKDIQTLHGVVLDAERLIARYQIGFYLQGNNF